MKFLEFLLWLYIMMLFLFVSIIRFQRWWAARSSSIGIHETSRHMSYKCFIFFNNLLEIGIHFKPFEETFCRLQPSQPVSVHSRLVRIATNSSMRFTEDQWWIRGRTLRYQGTFDLEGMAFRTLYNDLNGYEHYCRYIMYAFCQNPWLIGW